MRIAPLALSAAIALGVAGTPASADTVFPCENLDRNAIAEVPKDRIEAFRTIVRGYAAGLEAQVSETGGDGLLSQLVLSPRADWSIGAESPDAGGTVSLGYSGESACRHPLSPIDKARWQGLMKALRRGGIETRPGIPWRR